MRTDAITLIDVSIWEVGGQGQGGYRLGISLLGGGSVSFGQTFKTKTEARKALIQTKNNIHEISMDEGFAFLHAILFHVQNKRIIKRQSDGVY